VEHAQGDPARPTTGTGANDSDNAGPNPNTLEMTENLYAIPGVRERRREIGRGDGAEQQTPEHAPGDQPQLTGTVATGSRNTAPNPATTETTGNPRAIRGVRGNMGGGGFEENVRIYRAGDSGEYRIGRIMIDSGNRGPNLITTAMMDYVGVIAGEPRARMIYVDGNEGPPLGGEVTVEFSGDGDGPLPMRRFEEVFCHIPRIQDGFDMLMNRDFLTAVLPDRIPESLAAMPIFMVRAARLTPG
jgi:hypothetical protein